MKIAVVLNFNNYRSTIECTNNLIDSGIDKVVVVDNASQNNSYRVLKKIFKNEDRVKILFSSQNGGYSSGNNIGLKYITKNYGEDNIIYIVNPDTTVNKSVIDHTALFIKKNKNAGMVTVKMNDTLKNVWHHTGLTRGFFFNFWFISHLLYKFNITEAKHYKSNNQSVQPVDVVMGSFFGIDQKIFNSVNFFDDNTFLYYEEEILYCKLKKRGYQNYILNDFSFKHKGQGSTNTNRLKIKIINDESRLYYLKNYNGANRLYVNVYKIINVLENYLIRLVF